VFISFVSKDEQCVMKMKDALENNFLVKLVKTGDKYGLFIGLFRIVWLYQSCLFALNRHF